ncbi:MAG: AMP-binding protein, partial [Gammaproteobacteria bacterium]|nr:AMP-binding protein [Gammaproteobacteria bacterium]
MLLHDYLEHYARTTPENPFAEMAGVQLNYRAADKRANQIAHSLLSAGLTKGDHFAYLSKNSIDMA